MPKTCFTDKCIRKLLINGNVDEATNVDEITNVDETGGRTLEGMAASLALSGGAFQTTVSGPETIRYPILANNDVREKDCPNSASAGRARSEAANRNPIRETDQANGDQDIRPIARDPFQDGHA
jgi:hypothetical protein